MAKNFINFTLILIILAFIWLPLGDPTDFIVVPKIIQAVGMQNYIILSIVLVYLLYTNIEGKTIKAKFENITKGFKKILG